MRAVSHTWRPLGYAVLRGLPLTVGLIAVFELLARTFLRTPSLTALLAVVAYVAFIGGLRSGLVSAALVSLYGLYYFSIPGQAFEYTREDVLRVLILTATSATVALTTGWLRASLGASEQRLRRERDFRRAIDDSIAEGVYALDTEGRVTFMNPAAEQMLGWTQAELLGKVMHDVTHYQRADGTPYPREECSGLQVLRNGVTYRSDDDVFTCKDGALLPVSYSSAPILQGGQTVGAVVAFRDIRERKRTEQVLRKWADIFEHTETGLVISSGDGSTLAMMNPAFARMHGYTVEELTGRPITDVLPLARHVEVAENTRLAREKGHYTYESEHVRKDGTVFPVQVDVTAVTDGSDNVLYRIINVTDITERKRAEEELRASEGQLRLITEQMPAHLWITDRDMRIVSVSGSILAQLGVDSSRYVGKTLYELTPSASDVLEAHKRALRGEGTGYDLEVRGRVFEARVRPLRDARDRVVGCVGLALDVTERKRAERRLVAQYTVSRVLSESPNLGDAAPRVLQAMGEGLDWDYGALWTVDHEVLRCVEAWHSSSVDLTDLIAESRTVSFRPGEGLPGSAWVSGGPRWITDTSAEPNFPRLRLASFAGLRSGFGLPIQLGGRVVAVMEYLSCESREPDPEVLDIAASLGGQLGQFMERTRAEEELRRSEALKGSVLASALDAIVTMDREGKVVEWNPAAERMFGYTVDEALGEEMAALIVPPRWRDEHRQGLARYLATGEGPVLDRRIEMAGMRSDGSEFPVELAITRIPWDGTLMFTGYIRDITSRKAADEALEARARQQAAVAELGRRALASRDLSALMDEAVVIVARTLRIEYCKVLELLPEGDALLLRAGVGWKEGYVGRATVGRGSDSQAGYTLATGGPVVVDDLRAELRFAGPPLLHEHGVVSGISVPIPGHERPFGVLGAHTTSRRSFTADDVYFLQAIANVIATALEREAFEEELSLEREEAQRLEELDRLRARFISSISHDLRTPLTAAGAGLGMLDMSAGERLLENERQLVANVRRNVERLRLLIDDLLTYNQLEAGTLKLDCRPLDLRSVVTDAMSVVLPLIREKGQWLEKDLPHALPSNADPWRLGQVMVNVLANAHQHTRPGTRIIVSGHVADGKVVLSVSDDGDGIAPEDIETIFQRFHHVGPAHGGSGLGLAIAREIVELHGGRMWAESEPGEGAKFHIQLPGASASGVEEAIPSAALPCE
ncbi:MAG: PAS domain S-box protein [Chloroflexota bacterium]|nr:PAS domain S-box protein [Chloroflexota bacterium]